MLKRKENNKKSINKSQLLVVGSFLILIGLATISSKYIYKYIVNANEEIMIQEFYEIQENEDKNEEEIEYKAEDVQEIQKNTEIKNNYIAVIKIDKIGLEKGLYSKDNVNNNVNKNIQILKESSYPDVEKGNFILAGHSGNSRVSYFRKLNKLDLDDEVSIFYNNHEYKYKVVNIYDIEKNGNANIIRNAEKTTLTLITCRSNTNKQIVVICELES